MGLRTCHFNFLQGDGDGFSLKRADPDRQIPVTVNFPQQNDALLVGQTDPNTVDYDFHHLRHL